MAMWNNLMTKSVPLSEKKVWYKTCKYKLTRRGWEYQSWMNHRYPTDINICTVIHKANWKTLIDTSNLCSSRINKKQIFSSSMHHLIKSCCCKQFNVKSDTRGHNNWPNMIRKKSTHHWSTVIFCQTVSHSLYVLVSLGLAGAQITLNKATV